MAVLHQFDYLFAIGIIFAFLDAFMIGANDVANSFATSVSSRSLTMKQAMVIATFCEFGGALAVGARVADTIRTKILSQSLFEKDPSVLMLVMVCALVGSSTFISIATKLGMPVSTTHSIIGGVLGAGIAAVGTGGVNWGWKGVSQVFAAWAIAPAIAGGFAAVLFIVTKYGVLKRKNPVMAAFIAVPIYFAITSGILTMLIVWKGAASLNLDNWSTGQVLGCILGVAFGVAALCVLFFLPYLYRKLIKEDWQLRWYHIPMGPLLLRRGEVPERPVGAEVVEDYYRGYHTNVESENGHISADGDSGSDVEKGVAKENDEIKSHGQEPTASAAATTVTAIPAGQGSQGPWYQSKNLARITRKIIFHGVDVDVVESQKAKSAIAGDVTKIHAAAPHYDNKAEHTYSFLQVLTAATASFAHGANDVSNAIGPLATIYLVWSTGALQSKSPVPIWILAFGGGAIVLGLWFYGYNIMRNLGNRITLHSPSRGFSMELGSAITVVMATRLALPVSTTQCISGATVGVGLCSGTWRTINWRMVAWIYFSWIITLPFAGITAGCLAGIILNAPRWGLGV